MAYCVEKFSLNAGEYIRRSYFRGSVFRRYPITPRNRPLGCPQAGISCTFLSLGINHLAIRRKFWAVAASKNSSCAPESPRSRKRSSFKIRFRCANSISTFFRSQRDCRYSGVVAMARATFRSASWMLRAILRVGVLGQHWRFCSQVLQSDWLDR